MASAPAQNDLIRHIFERIGFAFLRVDLVGVADGLENPQIHLGTHCAASLHNKTERYRSFLAAMHGLMRSIDVPSHFAELFADTPILRDERQCGKALLDLVSNPNAPVAYGEVDDRLVWEEASPWPLAYGAFFTQLTNLILLFQTLIVERKSELAAEYEKAGYAPENISILDQSSRVLPSKLHFAAASFGAWLGGAENWQYLALFATEPQIRDSAINIDYAKRILYSEQDSTDLDTGGVIAIPASLAVPLLELQQSSMPILGGVLIDETNGANAPTYGPNVLPNTDGPDVHPGFLLDKQYRAAFYARALKDHALYGASNVLRDHYEGFYKNVKQVGIVRCKHYCIPIVEVGSVGELRSLASAIPIHSDEGVFFRGQSSMYTLNRPQRVRDLLFGASCSTEPSLSTSAARNRFDYDSLHFALRYYLEYYELDTGRSRKDSAGTKRYERWRQESNSPLCEIDYAVMALAQHYGLPSHGLDVTDDIDVGVWFATNRFHQAGDVASYTPLQPDQWNSEESKWPVIFALQRVTHSLGMSIQKCREFEAFGLPALRPQRQAASFFLGGHGDHQNRLAESLVCAFRLKPGSYDTLCDFNHLFPAPEDDPAYAAMLRFQDFRPFQPLIGGKVTRFHSI